jgi:selenide,water dikinase
VFPHVQMEEELVQMLAGALTMLSAANCSLVGGHTSEGAEAALGFSVTGVVHPAKALAKGPLPRGSALILTKALGMMCTLFYCKKLIVAYCVRGFAN